MIRGAAALACCIVSGTCAAQRCGDSLGADLRTVQSERYVVAYTTTPAKIAVGEHFVVDFAVCPRADAGAPQAVRVDAAMPEHRHGMNYRAGVTAKAPGLYRAEGLLFHMRGRWDLTFDVVAPGGTEHLSSTIRLE